MTRSVLSIVCPLTAISNFHSPEVQKKLAEQRSLIRDAKGGMIHAVSAGNGKKLSELKLESIPVWDGMIAAQGRLYISSLDGSIVCLGGLFT